ncbi:MbcA/ParS/Xre antitoxin family protein [Paucibacter soli]|uniref:MbcA/ParS/Xre antitoxin family protein n=1 Tax=Paucibacter soli TaxID=3133433 RepID=UPI0030956778
MDAWLDQLANGMSPDLVHIAKVRRILLDLGAEIGPDVISAGTFSMGPIERWLHTPVDAFGGRSPFVVLGEVGGDDLVRSVLQQAIQQSSVDSSPQ